MLFVCNAMLQAGAHITATHAQTLSTACVLHAQHQNYTTAIVDSAYR